MLSLEPLSRPVLDSSQTLLVIFLLAFTRQNSIFRYLSIPVLTFIVKEQITQPPAVVENFHQWLNESSVPFNYLHHINILALTSIDLRNDNNGVLPGLFDRIKSAFIYQLNPRGVGTRYQVKNIPPVPEYYKKRKGYLSQRYRFVVRQLCLFVWQYLIVDVGCSLWHNLPDQERFALFGPGTEWNIINAGPQQWKVRLMAAMIFWTTARNAVDLSHRLGSAVLTGIGATSVHEWPPMCGSLRDAYTLRNLWGKWWHQQLRWTLSSHSNFVTRRLLKLPRRSLLERYLNNAIVHVFSAFIHVNGWRLAGIPDGYIGPSLFYMSFVGGYLVEDFVQHIWATLFRSRSRTSTGIFFERLTGIFWVATFLTVTTPWWIYPLLRREHSFALPVSLVESVGMNNALAMIGVGAFILKTRFDANI
uniref:Acetyltransferase cdmC n=1 Tax=Talaromyces verruculosus TaxID=198730 RepID=CDMC_TALVE|nr:RecName: Full=Acetyltransferase cdmC; AltName: Full=chrodrimanin B biosynthesis cluster protein C [Talaromyces verruculosus]BBG28482.1 acetyltransferase CdmC [Talaromyces verruculosus]